MSTPGQVVESHRGVRGYACEPCARRKVRCDRLEPCSNCRRRTNDTCVYTVTEPTHIAKRKRSTGPGLEPSVASQTQHVLPTTWTPCGGIVDRTLEYVPSDPGATPVTRPGPGRLLFSHLGAVSVPLQEYLPPSRHIWYLWRSFLTNVYPLTYFFPAWQKEKLIVTALDRLHEARPSTLAFLFNMLGLAIYSLSDGECIQVMGDDRSTLLDRYQVSRDALAGWLLDDLRLLGMRPISERLLCDPGRNSARYDLD